MEMTIFQELGGNNSPDINKKSCAIIVLEYGKVVCNRSLGFMLFLNKRGCHYNSVKCFSRWICAALLPQADFDCSLYIGCLRPPQHVSFLYSASGEDAKERRG